MTIQGVYSNSTHKNDGRVPNGISLTVAPQPGDPESGLVLKVYNNKVPDPIQDSSNYTTVTSFVSTGCCHKGVTPKKFRLDDAEYVWDGKNVYRLRFYATSFQVGFNKKIKRIKKVQPPAESPVWGNRMRLQQLGRATTFSAVTVCPLNVSVVIVQGEMDEVRRECEGCTVHCQGCKAVGDIVQAAGTPLNVTCFATGPPPLDIWWEVDGVYKSPDSASSRHLGDLSAYTLVISSLELDSSGTYSCVTRNTLNDSLSANAKFNLVVYSPIQMFVVPEKMNSMRCNTSGDCEGSRSGTLQRYLNESLSLSCKVFGSHLVEMWWEKDWENLTLGGEYKVIRAQNISEITFWVTPETVGWYRCRAVYLFNHTIAASVSVEVRHIYPLTVRIVEPRNVIARLGDSVTFTCLIYEWPPSTQSASWRHINYKQSELYETTLGPINVDGGKYSLTTKTLEFNSVEESDSGVFKCGTNGVVKYASLYVEIEVEEPECWFTHNKTTPPEFRCATRSIPPAELVLVVREIGTNETVPVFLRDISKQGSYQEKTWRLSLTNHPELHKAWFVCRAKQRNTETFIERYLTKETSGQVALHRDIPLTIEMKITPVNQLRRTVKRDNPTMEARRKDQQIIRFREGEAFMVTCRAAGYPPPVWLALTKDGEVITQKNRSDLLTNSGSPTQKEMWEVGGEFLEVNVTFQMVSVEDGGMYDCWSGIRGINTSLSTIGDEDSMDWTSCRVGEINTTHFNVSSIENREMVESLISHGNWVSCPANETRYGRQAKISVFQSRPASPLRFSFLPEVIEKKGRVQIMDSTHVQVRCAAQGGVPPPRLQLLVNGNILGNEREEDHGDEAIVWNVLWINRTVELGCEAWQEQFIGGEVLVRNKSVTLISTSRTPMTLLSPSFPSLPLDLMYWGVWAVVGMVGLGMLLALLFFLILCFRRRAPDDGLEPLSSSEDLRIRAQSIDLAERRMELLSNLAERPLSSPKTRITRSMSRSREGLESIRMRQRTQSGDTLGSGRGRAQSGDLVEDQQARKRGRSDEIIRDESRLRHTSC